MSTPPPPPLRILISGAGIAGPALALHLSRLPPPLTCTITIIDRHPTLRNTGQQVDLRGQGVSAMRALGPDVERAVRAKLVDEPGLRIVDWRGGKQAAFFGSNKSGKGAQTFSAEWEIMRGDLCEVLWERTRGLDGVRYVFGVGVVRFEQQVENGDGGQGPVRVWFSDGSEGEFDLLVGCDGVGSKIRRSMFTDGREDRFFPVGMAVAWYSVPPEKGDSPAAALCQYPGRRNAMTRRDSPDSLRVFLGYAGDDPELKRAIKRGTVAEQKEAWANVYKHDLIDAWGVRRFLDGMHSPQADDFYTQEFAQIRLDNWSEGRVVVLGDAAFCPAPITGMGTSLALAGAYVLAGEIARACGKQAQADGANPWDNLPLALAAYETTLRPFVKTVQDVDVKQIVGLMLPKSTWAIRLIHWVTWFLTVSRIDRLAARFSPDDRGTWKLPDYPELMAPKA